MTKQGRPLDWKGPIGDLARKLGRYALAQRLEVTPRTLYTWAKAWERTKKLPDGPTGILLRNLMIGHGIEATSEK